MHHFYVYVPGIVRIALAYVEVGEDLVPDALFHSPIVFIKVTEILFIFAPHQGELAHLARALAWHARGNRFDSGILHFTGRKAK